MWNGRATRAASVARGRVPADPKSPVERAFNMKDMKKTYFFGNPCEMRLETKLPIQKEGMKEI